MNRPEDRKELAAIEPLPARAEDSESVFSPEWLVSRHKICVDTGSLGEASARQAIVGGLLPHLRAAGKSVTVLRRSVADIERQLADGDAARRFEWQQAERVLGELGQSTCLLIADDPHPLPGDPCDTQVLFAELFVGYQLEYALCLVTQSAELATRILRNARSTAFERAKPVVVVFLDKGRFCNWVPALLKRGAFELGQQPSGASRFTLDEAARDCRFVVDTCALMLDDIKDGSALGLHFFDKQLRPLLVAHQNPMIVPYRVMLELEKLKRDRDAAKVRIATDALSLVEHFCQQGIATLPRDEHEVAGSDRFADPLLLRVGIRYQNRYGLCFITQDTKLARTLLDNRAAGNGTAYHVTFIAQKSGELVPWEKKLADKARSVKEPIAVSRESERVALAAEKSPARPGSSIAQSSGSGRSTGAPTTRTVQSDRDGGYGSERRRPFSLSSALRRLDNTPLPLSSHPQEGSWVSAEGCGRLRLTSRISEGGEGVIYATDRSNLVCKVYHPECITLARKEKLALMLSREVRLKGVCWPVALACSEDGQFVGYVMPRAEGKTLFVSVMDKARLSGHFPGWDREQLTQLAVTILRTIESLHALNVLIGDVNPHNFMVRDEHTIYLVDTDSFQIEGFPCPVGSDTYTPARLQGKNFSALLRNSSDELFAVTTLLFHILFPGKAPYAAQGGGDIGENIRNRRFPYGQERSAHPPSGPWFFIWTHLHSALKRDFTTVFARDERVSIRDLIDHLEWSLKSIKSGNGSRELFPDKPATHGETVEMVCPKCPPGANLHELAVATAERLKSENKPFVCKACLDRERFERDSSAEMAECQAKHSPDCEGRVLVPKVHLDQIRAKGQSYWCKTCSTAMRAERMQGARRYGSAGSTQSKRSSCFVATAAYGSQDAPPVVYLRAWRDAVLKRSTSGRAFIAAYYRIGPWLAIPVRAFPPLRKMVCRALDGLVARLKRHHGDL